jgi:hypothetical protein
MRYTDKKYLYLENDNGIKSKMIYFGSEDLDYEIIKMNIFFILTINDDNSMDLDFDDESDLILEEENLTSLEKNNILNEVKDLLLIKNKPNPFTKLIFE